MNAEEKLKRDCAIRKAERIAEKEKIKSAKVKPSKHRGGQRTIGKCKYYNAKVFKHGDCDKGINVRKMVGGDDCGWLRKTPCFTEHKTNIGCLYLSIDEN